jgi:phosphoglycolate phosphatase
VKLYISKNIKAIVFDLDGTLINSSLTVLDILNQIRRKYLNKKKINLKKISKFLSIGGKILIKKTLQIKKEKEIISYLKIFRHIYLSKKFNTQDIFPNVINFLKRLKKKNIKIIICTNKNSKLVKKIVNESPFRKYVNFFVTSDMVNSYKPDKVFLDFIFKKTNISKDNLLYIGDSQIDLKLCNDYNINFLLFKNSLNDISKRDLIILKKKKIVFSSYKSLMI